MKVLASKALTYSITGIILLSGLLFAYMVLAPVDVLTNWSLSVDASRQYAEGDTIIVNTRFDKLRSITGRATRYIVCDTPDHTNVRIEINEAAANRQNSKDNNELIYLAVPEAIPALPSTCQIEIVIEYTVYSFRKHIETARTNSFTVIERTENEDPVSINDSGDNRSIEDAPRSGSSNSSIMPQRPVAPAQPIQPPPNRGDNTDVEDSPRVPACNTLFINLLIGEICVRSSP